MKTQNTTTFITLWENILTAIKQELTDSNYNTWFGSSKAMWLQDNGTVLVVGVPNEFIKNWISKKYLSFMNKKLKEESNEIKNIKIIVSSKPKQNKVTKKNNISADDTQLSFERIDNKNNLNKKYSFKEFIISPHNEYVCAAAKAVVNKLGVAYNPFFIFGNTGVGKTHLLQAIGNQAAVMYPNIKIYYMSSETFINGYYNALQDGTVGDFKTKYRDYHLLIVDDAHFFKGKAKMLEEFFHLFNDLYNKNHQIVFSSDRHPQELDGIEERMISRFSSGMVLELSQPDGESREIILKESVSSALKMLFYSFGDFHFGDIINSLKEYFLFKLFLLSILSKESCVSSALMLFFLVIYFVLVYLKQFFYFLISLLSSFSFLFIKLKYFFDIQFFINSFGTPTTKTVPLSCSHIAFELPNQVL